MEPKVIIGIVVFVIILATVLGLYFGTNVFGNNGGWSEWEDSECSAKTCGLGDIISTRKCKGKDCKGQDVKVVECSSPCKARYVKISGPNVLNLLQIKVIDQFDENIALNKTVTASSEFDNKLYPPSHLVDGDIKTNFAHTKAEEENWFLIDLGEEYNIKKVVVYNRTDCCGDRIKDSVIQLKNKDSEIINESDKLKGDKLIYTFIPISNSLISV